VRPASPPTVIAATERVQVSLERVVPAESRIHAADRQECLSYLVAWAGEHVAGDGGLQCGFPITPYTPGARGLRGLM